MGWGMLAQAGEGSSHVHSSGEIKLTGVYITLHLYYGHMKMDVEVVLFPPTEQKWKQNIPDMRAAILH